MKIWGREIDGSHTYKVGGEWFDLVREIAISFGRLRSHSAYRAEGEHASKRDEHGRPGKPPLGRDQARNGVDAAGIVGCSAPVAAEDRAEDAQRQGDQRPHQHLQRTCSARMGQQSVR